MRNSYQKYATKIISSMLVIALTIIAFIGFDLTTAMAASMSDLAVDYELGETYAGIVQGTYGKNSEEYGDRYFRFQLPQKSHVSIVCEYKGITYDDVGYVANIYNSSGKLVLKNGDISTEINTASGWGIGKQFCVLSEGEYYIEFPDNGNRGIIDYSFRFRLQAEPIITLPKGKIRSLKSAKAGQVTIVCQSVSDAIGYKIQYSTDYKFKKNVKTKYIQENKITITNLSKGKKYYFKVCPYNVYDDGEYALGQNSKVKSIKIKK